MNLTLSFDIYDSTDFGQLYSSSEIVYNVNRRDRMILIIYYKRKGLDTYHITHVKSKPFPDPQMTISEKRLQLQQ